jgi:hypothetical protein
MARISHPSRQVSIELRTRVPVCNGASAANTRLRPFQAPKATHASNCLPAPSAAARCKGLGRRSVQPIAEPGLLCYISAMLRTLRFHLERPQAAGYSNSASPAQNRAGCRYTALPFQPPQSFPTSLCTPFNLEFVEKTQFFTTTSHPRCRLRPQAMSKHRGASGDRAPKSRIMKRRGSSPNGDFLAIF